MDNGSESYKRFLDGDDIGMEDIITEYRDGLIFYLHKLVGSIEKAEELAEDTFVLLCIKKPKDKQKCSFKTWLYTIGRNLAIDYLRRSAKQITMPLDTYDTLCSDQDSPEEEYIRNSKKTIVNKALNKLKPEYRQVLWLLYFEDLQYKEISIINEQECSRDTNACQPSQASTKKRIDQGGIYQ